MAVLDRRTWLEIRDELMLRVGRNDVTSFESRAEEFVTAANFYIGTIVHQYELNEVDTSLVLSTSSRELALPSDCWGIFSFSIGHPSTAAWIATLTWEHAQSIFKGYSITAAQPDTYTRYGNDIQLQAKPEQAYKTVLRYYRTPLAPDFDGVVEPEYGRQWDEVILDKAEALAWKKLGRPDLSKAADELVREYLELSPQPLLRDIPLFGPPTVETRTTPHGGAQG